MAPPPDNDDQDKQDRKDPTVKQLLARDKPLEEVVDAVTAAELQRWFGLPSFTQLAEAGKPVEDPTIAAARERRAVAVAAVDPAMLAAINLRLDRAGSLARVQPPLEVHLDLDLMAIDLAMVDRQHSVAEPREVEIPFELQEDLRECTPQALLRDLHRPELDFEKVFEVVDALAEQQLDVVAVVKEAMLTSWKLPPLEANAYLAARAAQALFRQVVGSPWPALFNTSKLPNRTVAE